ncbi:hypothetical protein IE4803_PB00503 (plasmid) [Rhizobium etli bv. phaseoli str. IE4803]|nr:hypothetical protein IE4803_PB00503 [Rhizobium etli bv. phaseoli str. IE4803]
MYTYLHPESSQQPQAAVKNLMKSRALLTGLLKSWVLTSFSEISSAQTAKDVSSGRSVPLRKERRNY